MSTELILVGVGILVIIAAIDIIVGVSNDALKTESGVAGNF